MFGEPTAYHEPYDSFILKSVNFKRKLQTILESIPKKHQRILYGSFANVRMSMMIANIFTKFTGSAYLNTYLTPTKLESLCVKLYQGKISSKDQVMISQIRAEATQNYYLAINKYIKAKRIVNRKEKENV